MFKKNLLVLLVIVGIAAIPIAYSATTYTVFNVPPMRLNEGISATATSFDVAAPIRNGAKVTYPATGGGILELKNSRFQEYIYYSSATVDGTTQVVTMTGAVRGYCWNSNTFASCEAGRVWAKGTQVTLVNDMRLFNFSLKRDISNTMTGSGRVTSDQTTQTWLTPTNVTTAQRDAFTDVRTGDVIFNTTLGIPQYYDGANWVSYGTGALINATTAARGVVTLASTGAAFTGSGQGIGGSFNVLQSAFTTASGGLSTTNAAGYTVKAGFLAAIGKNGFLSGAVLGQGWVGTGGLVLTDANTWINPQDLISVATSSGVNLSADISQAGNQALTIDSYTDITGATTSQTVSSGSTTVIFFNTSVSNGSCSAADTLTIAIQKDSEVITGSGMFLYDLMDSGGVGKGFSPLSFTYPYKNRSAGTFTYKAVYKSQCSDGNTKFSDSVNFQTITIE